MTFRDTAEAQSCIYGALKALDEINQRTEEDDDLQVLKDFFSGGEDIIKAFANGAAAPEVLDQAGTFEGKYSHYAHTGLLYTSILAFAGKKSVSDEDIAFGYGCLAHYVVDKHVNPVIKDFAGWVDEIGGAGKTVPVFNYFDGSYQAGRTENAGGQVNVIRHKWLKNWFVKGLLMDVGAWTNNTTLELVDDPGYYSTDPFSSSQQQIIEDAYNYLWEIEYLSGLDSGSQTMSDYTSSMAAAHEEDYSLRASDISDFTVFPNSHEFNTLFFALGEAGGEYSGLYSRFRQAMNAAAAEIVELLLKTAPYLEDELLSKVTIRDTRLENIDLYTGELSDREMPYLTGDINPAELYALVSNPGSNSVLPVRIDGSSLDPQSTIVLSGAPERVTFGPTGRFAYVSLNGGGVEWIDMTPNADLKWLSEHGEFEDPQLTGMGSGSGPLEVSQDSSRLYVGRGNGYVDEYDLSRRELISSIAVGGTCRDMDITADGKDLMVTTHNDGAGSGTLEKLKIDFEEPLSSGGSTTLGGCIRGVATGTYGDTTYVTTKRRESSGLLSPYFDPLYVVRGSGVDKVNTHVEGSNYTFIVDCQVYYVPMLVWPAVVSTLCSINTPPHVLMQIITNNPTGLLGLLPLGGGLLAPIIFSTPVPIIVLFKMNPVGLYQGVDIAVVPASKYGISPVYGAFGFSGNIGVLDRDSRKFYAGTTNELVSLYMSGGPYYPLKRIGVSQVGDIIGPHPGKDKIGFGEGKKIFQALHQGDAETFTTFPGLFPAFIPGIGLGGNLSRPSDAVFQPIVYRYNNLALDGEGEYMVFSRYLIGDILNGSPLLGVEFREQQDRFWSLKAEGNPTLEVEFKDGDLPKVYLGESQCRPTPAPGPSPGPTIEVPEIENVEREYKCAFYVQNFGAEEIVNEYKVHAPGADSVWFKLNGAGTKAAVQNDWATHTYNMGEDLVPDLFNSKRNEFWFQPEGGDFAGEPYGPLYEWLIPCPKWLAYLIKTGWERQNLGDKIKTSFEIAYPDPALEAHIERVKDWVPFIGGHPLGIRETQVGLAGELTCVGQGSLSGFGRSGFDALGAEIGAELKAEGIIRVDTTKGIYFHKAKIQLDVNGKVSREFGIVDAIPYVNTLSFPGKSWINDHCKITPYLECGLNMPLLFKECDQPPLGLCFDHSEPAGTIGAGAVLVIKLPKLEAELGGGGTGTITLQVPKNPGYLKEMELNINTWIKATALDIWEVCDWSHDWEWKWEFGDQTGNPPRERRMKPICKLISRDYIKDPDYTRSIVKQRRGALDRFRSLPRGASTVTLGLAQAVFPGGSPALAARGDELLMLFVYDDPEKANLQQALEIAYLSYDGTSWTTWSGKPPLLTDDTHADLNPRMVVDGNGNYLAVWERVRDPNLSEAGGVEGMAAQLEIAYSVYNGGSWSELSYLTDNNYIDSSPLLSVSSSGQVMLIWNSNADSRLFGDINHPSEIRSAIWDGAEWSDETVAVSGLNGVYIPAVSYTAETEATLVFSQARDGDDPDLIPPSQDMSEIYYSHYDGSNWTEATTLTDDSLDDVSPQIIDVEGTQYLIWSRDGEMVMLEGLENWPPELVKEGGERTTPPDYKLVEDEDHNLVLVWAHASEEGNDIFYNVYDAAEGVWGEDQKLSGDDYLEKDFAPVFDQSGDLIMAYNRVEVEMDENGVPRLGQTDLYVLRHSLGIDLGIDSEDISFVLLNPPPGPAPTPYPAPGDEVEIKAEVKNLGDKVCNSIEVAFYNGDPDEGGAQISATQVIDTIAPGGSGEASVAWMIPADDNICRIYVVVDPANAIVELNEENNKAFSDALLLPDLCLKSLYYQPQGEDGIVVDALIANQGTVAAPVCTLELRKDTVDGELLGSEVVNPLTAGSEVTVSIEVDTGDFSLQSEVVIYGIVDSGEEILETDETNNVNFNYIWIDFDHDGMVDAWERIHGLSPLLGDGGGARDFVLLYVTAWGIPLHPGFNLAEYPFEELNQETDRDGDGLTNLEEHLMDSDPLKSDTDADGMSDGWECDYGLDLNVDDGALDLDEDGFTNLEEYTAGTDPQDSQSHP